MLRFGKTRRLGSLCLAGLLLLSPLGSAQDGHNFHALGNLGDAIYPGFGAGLGSTPGVDVTGYWMAGEDMQGATFSGLTDGSGAPQFGYQQSGMRVVACVLNNPVRLDFPAIVITEYAESDLGNGFNFHNPYSFLRPGCDDVTDGTPLNPFLDANRDLVKSSVFGMQPGTPPGTTVAWLLSGQVPGLPSSVVFLTPNAGLIPTNAGGTQGLVAALSASVSISTTGCFVFDLDWTATLGSSLPAVDNTQGWWTALAASRDNNQYWSVSQDHLNLVNSLGAYTQGSGSSVASYGVTVDIEAHSFSADPITQVVLAPLSWNGAGVYYANPEGQLNVGGSPLNPGFDLGIAPALSSGANFGAQSFNSLAGLGPLNVQDPANAGLVVGPNPTSTGITPTIGFVTFNNNPYAAGLGGSRLTWVQIDTDLTVNRSSPANVTHPSEMTDVGFAAFPGVRVPTRIPKNNVGSWPQPLTINLFSTLQHETLDRTGDPLWQDPTGLPAGAMGIPTVTGASAQLPITTITGACSLGGLPVGIMYGSSGLQTSPSAALTWDPSLNRVSVGRSVLLYD